MSRGALRPGVVLAAVLALATGALPATEIGATRLVFEKSSKLKKTEAALYLSHAGDEARQLACRVMARGRRGPIPVAGSFALRLVGESDDGREFWQSAAVERAVDGDGNASFEVGDLAGLAAQSALDEARPRLVRVDFRGGRGGRASELTVDCIYERVGP